MKPFILFFLSLCCSIQIAIGQHAIADFDPPVNGYVSNPDYIFNENQVSVLNESVLAFEKETGIEIAVVVVETVGGTVPRIYGQQLFNKWGVGKKGKNNGLMILLSRGDRRVEFIPGDGVKHIMDQKNSVRIQQSYMLPDFKQGNYYLGLKSGLQEVQSYMRNYSKYGFIGAYFFGMNPFFQVYFMLSFVLSLSVFIYVFYQGRSKEDPFKTHQKVNTFDSWVLLILFIIPYIFVSFYVSRTLKKLRKKPRLGPKTGKKLRLLEESEEDAHLSKVQITEEAINSIQYDVWASEADEEILILNYPQTSKFIKCYKCGAKAYSFSHKRVIKAATYSASGRGEKVHKCRHCKHIKKTTYTIPMKVEHQTTYDSSSSSSGYSSSSFDSSSSSSSFGGGYSSGGGGGSSW